MAPCELRHLVTMGQELQKRMEAKGSGFSRESLVKETDDLPFSVESSCFEATLPNSICKIAFPDGGVPLPTS